MARIKGSTTTGKIGQKILYTWNGRPCERAMPTHVANPRTAAQQSHRSAFAAVSKLSSYMKAAHQVGLQQMARSEKNNSFGIFKRLNKNCFADGDITYSRVVVSKGPVALARLLEVRRDDVFLAIAFDPASTSLHASPDDELFVFVYCPSFCEGILYQPVAREDGEMAVRLPDEWQPHPLHLYAFLRDRRNRTSNTLYRSLPPSRN